MHHRPGTGLYGSWNADADADKRFAGTGAEQFGADPDQGLKNSILGCVDPVLHCA